MQHHGDVSVAVLGLGRMGLAIVERLLSGRYQVAVWNRSSEPVSRAAKIGARPADSIEEAVHGCGVVMTSLTDGTAVRAVVVDTGLPRLMPEGSTLIELSTIDVATSAELAEVCGNADVGYLRAPVSGNPDAVRKGRAALLVSGAPMIVEQHLQILQTVAPVMHRVGDGDESRIAKLCVNLMLAGVTELLAEVIVLAEQSGLSRRTIAEALTTSVVGSTYLRYKAEAAIARNYEATFTTRDLSKDLRLLRDQADHVQVPIPIGMAVAELVDEAIAEGMGSVDFLCLLPRLQGAAGLPRDLVPNTTDGNGLLHSPP